jgi:hypothetical protein
VNRLKEWLRQWFHKSVYLEGDDDITLWIEHRWSAFYLPIKHEEILDIARQLNDRKTVSLQFKLGIAHDYITSYIIVPSWAFHEVRRLITQKALEEIEVEPF